MSSTESDHVVGDDNEIDSQNPSQENHHDASDYTHASEPAPCNIDSIGEYAQLEQLGSQPLPVNGDIMLNIIGLTDNDYDSSAATAPSELAGAPDTTIESGSHTDFFSSDVVGICEIEAEYSRLFFFVSPRHAVKYMYIQCLRLNDQQSHLAADRKQRAKRDLLDLLLNEVQAIHNRGERVTDQSVTKLNVELWRVFMNLHRQGLC
ncbi:hypothetical protein EON65_20330 [archaeon]|nr:MAG: hypothetical protein EON65_20330 [archaeon]